MDKDLMKDKYAAWITKYIENDYAITKTCDDIGIHYQCYLKWRKDQLFMEMLTEARQGLVEMAENVLRKAAKNNDTDAAKFIIKTLGKNKDWQPDQQKIDITSAGQPIGAIINIIKPDDTTE